MKVSISGKGGSGKTTISGTVARMLGRSAGRVLAVDGDPNPNLSITLGLDRSRIDEISPLPHGLMSHTQVNGEVHVSLSKPVGEVLSQFGVDCPDNVTLLQIGQPPGSGTG